MEIINRYLRETTLPYHDAIKSLQNKIDAHTDPISDYEAFINDCVVALQSRGICANIVEDSLAFP